MIKKLFAWFNTETPVLDEPSKKILRNDDLLCKYYRALEDKKNGKRAFITVDGVEYEILRPGKD